MPAYRNLHLEKPEVNRLIYWMGPDTKDILGWFRGKLQFHEVERKYPGYIPKWWYYAEDHLNIPDPLFSESLTLPRKRGKRPKNEVEEKVEIQTVIVPDVIDRMVQVFIEEENDDFDGEFF